MITESSIENNFIKMLISQGYTHFYGPNIGPNGGNSMRQGFDIVVLETELKNSLKRLNPNIPKSALQEAYNNILHLGSSDLMINNEKFHNYLTDGITVEYFDKGETKGINMRLLDLENMENNNFVVVNQFTIRENNIEKRLDAVIFVNGLPLVVIELKDPLDEEATLQKAFTQIQNYKNIIPSIFYYNSFCIISDGVNAKYGSISANFERYFPWKIKENKKLEIELQTMSEKMLSKETLLKLIRYNIVFENTEEIDEKTGQKSITKVKKIAQYHQYYAVEKAINETIRATSDFLFGQKEIYKGQKDFGNRKIGVVWHTQGSGKSLSMVFFVGRLIVNPKMKNPTIVVITDRNDLDDQLFTTFANCKSLLRQEPVRAKSRENLKELLKVVGGGIVFTTIQKFSPEEGNIYDTLSERTNIVVIADEAHRSQYGFTGKLVESEIRYGNAKYLRDALPNASFIGFTGTPIEKEDRSTRGVFGNEIDIYDIKQAVDDGATVPINYESRLVKIRLNEEVVNKIDYAIDEIELATPEQIQKAKAKNAKINSLVGNFNRLKDVAKDIVNHFEQRLEVFEGKAMIVCMTREICVNLYDEIIKLRPNRYEKDLAKGSIKIVMTNSSFDPTNFQPHFTTKQQRKDLALRFKNPDDELKVVIVQSMWLTGFDVPCLHTMYIDKKMQGANLMQAIARVNRVYKDKPAGLIVDYIGIGQDLRDAMGIYTNSGGEGKLFDEIADVIAQMKTKFEIVENIFDKYNYEKYFEVEDTNEKLQIILEAVNFVLKSDETKIRFLKEFLLLLKLFVMGISTKEAEEIRDKVAFFEAVKTRINKLENSDFGGKSDKQVETAIKQIVEDALSSDGIIDIFDAMGLKKQDISILSDEFLLEVAGMKQQNIAFELLKKLLNNEVNLRKKKSLVQGKKFSEMLETIVKKYHNNQIDTAKVIQELSEMAKEMRLEDKKAQELGLSEREYAFYSVLSENTSTKFLEDHKMKELIHIIVEKVRNNATVDWEKRDDVRAKLRLEVKKVLMKYGYPPDLARIEADRILEQSELLAEEFTSN